MSICRLFIPAALLKSVCQSNFATSSALGLGSRPRVATQNPNPPPRITDYSYVYKNGSVDTGLIQKVTDKASARRFCACSGRSRTRKRKILCSEWTAARASNS
jgi:hypothetical protein